MRHTHSSINQDFRCMHCRSYVTTERMYSSVNNRNHCPYCLWTRHLDLYQPGDRLSACKAAMQPIGLTIKENHKKYGRQNSGELMLVHHCRDCGQISINRIAADDFLPSIEDVYRESHHIVSNLQTVLVKQGIILLKEEDQDLVRSRLFGYAYEKHTIG